MRLELNRPSKLGDGKFTWVMALMVLSLGSCAPTQEPSLPGPKVVDVVMTEYRFNYDVSAVRSGRVLFKARNNGRLSHQIVISILPAGTPPILEQLKSPERKVVSQLASFPPKPPGATAAFAVDFEPGRYAMICFVPDADGKQHGEKGMATEFTIK